MFFPAVSSFGGLALPEAETWGFFGHRRINRMAVFTLPPEMIRFYKNHIEFLTEHAVDPDKRRYATKHEAVRHYIDIDHWGTYPFPEVPRDWTGALLKYTDIYMLSPEGDTLLLLGPDISDVREGNMVLKNTTPGWEHPLLSHNLSEQTYRQFFSENILNNYYEDEWLVDCDKLAALFPGLTNKLPCSSAFALDHFSEYGILPYHLLTMQNNLTEAFRQQDVNRILRLSSEMGHYIGDAHVPLHTTENYNGQLTNQVGIHAFWESRIPELFADENYDFFVGKAEYIDNASRFFWKTVLESHALLDSVLLIEKELSETFPEDKQYCYDLRLQRTVRTQCKEYAAAYHNRMAGMVESRMRASIHALGCSWYTAWVDAGQPDLNGLIQAPLSKKQQRELEELESNYRNGEVKGRRHE